jgi:hypothetical protein
MIEPRIDDQDRFLRLLEALQQCLRDYRTEVSAETVNPHEPLFALAHCVAWIIGALDGPDARTAETGHVEWVAELEKSYRRQFRERAPGD